MKFTFALTRRFYLSVITAGLIVTGSMSTNLAAAEHALFDANPQQRYMVVGDAARADRTMRALLHRMLELNENQPFTYDREGLIKLLDEELAIMNQ